MKKYMLAAAFIAGFSVPSLAATNIYTNDYDINVEDLVGWAEACGAVDPLPGYHCEVRNGRPVIVSDNPTVGGFAEPYREDKCVLGISYACSTHVRIDDGLIDPINDIDLSEILGGGMSITVPGYEGGAPTLR